MIVHVDSLGSFCVLFAAVKAPSPSCGVFAVAFEGRRFSFVAFEVFIVGPLNVRQSNTCCC